jgi:hypothetical protein
LFLLRTQQRIDLLDGKLLISGDDQHIDIAVFVLLAAGKRPKNERDDHMTGHAVQNIAESITQADGADDDLFQRLVDGRVSIRLIEPVSIAAEDAAVCEQFEFSLNRSSSPAGTADDLPQVK